MQNKGHPRGTRGSYARLICDACRSRKIKCALPNDGRHIQPSDDPQPLAKACARCRDFSFLCVVKGPASGSAKSQRKRGNRQQSTPSTRQSTPLAGHAVSAAPDESYIFSDLATTSAPSNSTSCGDTPTVVDRFKAMTTATGLVSAMLRGDRDFGVAIPAKATWERIALTKSVSKGLAVLLDESLVWHRFFLPFLPTLANLRAEIVAGAPANLSTQLLFALLALTALERLSIHLLQQGKLRQDLQTFISHNGQRFLYDPPVHRHSLAVFHLLMAYMPAALIAHHESAFTAVRNATQAMLSKSIAERLDLDNIATALASYPPDVSITSSNIESHVLDSLLWCRTLIQDVQQEGSLVAALPRLRRTLDHIVQILDTVRAALRSYVLRAPIIFAYHNVRCACTESQHYVRFRDHRHDLGEIGHIVEAHEESCVAHDSEIREMLRKARSDAQSNEQSEAAASLVATELNQSRARVATAAVFYAIMARLGPTTADNDISPGDATKVTELVMNAMKEPHYGHTGDLHTFLGRFAELRDSHIERVLTDFIDNSDKLTLEDVPFLPPHKSSSLDVLYHCRTLVNSSAVHMKGWNILHAHVDRHLALFDQCVRRLEGICAPADGSVDTPFSNGCLYAASAKLLRGLHSILAKWRTTTSAKPPDLPTPSSSVELQDSEYIQPDLADIDFEQLFGDWNNWPQADGLDFTQLL